MFNLAGTLAVFRALANPSLLIPHGTVSNFNQIPVPISDAFSPPSSSEKLSPSSPSSSLSPPSSTSPSSPYKPSQPDIRALVLDKDNCFAAPHSSTIHPPYTAHFASLSAKYPTIILSNTAGYTAFDPAGSHAAALSSSAGVPVLTHAAPKPSRDCATSIMQYFADRPEMGVTHPSQVCVVGDRLATDVLMANEGGMWSLWVKDGVREPRGAVGLIVKAEKGLEGWLRGRGWEPPRVVSPFE